MMTDIAAYLDFVLTLFFAFGFAFEVPIATILLVMMGVTTPQKLGEKRPYIIVGAFIIGMFLTPPDVISQTLLAIPMWVLFELGVFFSKAFIKEKKKREDESEEEYSQALASSAASDNEPPRFVPMSDEEMEAELDAIEAEEEEYDDEGDMDDHPPTPETMEENLKHANELRLQGDEEMARELLYDVLEYGDDKQIEVARNILKQLDED